MGLSFNDVVTRVRSIHTIATADSPDDAVVTGPVRIMSMHLKGGSAASTLTINNALTNGGGGTTIVLLAAANTSSEYTFAPNGVLFSTGLSATQAGTSAVGYITYIAD